MVYTVEPTFSARFQGGISCRFKGSTGHWLSFLASRVNSDAGVVMTLLDKKKRLEARRLCRRIRYLELAAEPDFVAIFARSTAFPEL